MADLKEIEGIVNEYQLIKFLAMDYLDKVTAKDFMATYTDQIGKSIEDITINFNNWFKEHNLPIVLSGGHFVNWAMEGEEKNEVVVWDVTIN